MAVSSTGTYIGEPYEVTINDQKVTIYAYFPENMASGKTVNGAVYWPGASGYALNDAEYQQISDYYSKNDDVDYIFFSFERCREYNGITDEAISQVVAQIQKEKNITIDFNMVGGFSAGGDEAVKNVLNILHNDGAAEQQQLILYDPYSRYNGFGYSLSEEDIKAMQNNETETFLITPTYRGNIFRDSAYSEGKFVNALAANGLEVVIIDGNFEHGNTTKRVIYDGWMDYLKGNVELEDIKDDGIGYQVSVPYTDKDGNVSWHVYKLSDLVDAKLHPGKYSATDLNSMNYALDKIDDIRVEVDADALLKRAESLLSHFTTFLTAAPSESTYTSTSVLLPEEASSLKTVRDALNKMAESAQNEIKKAIHAADEYIKLEADLKKNSSALTSMFKDKLDDLKIAFVPLEVEIDDPEEKEKNKKQNSNYKSGGGYYGGGATNTTPEDTKTEEETKEEEKPTDEEPKPVADNNTTTAPTTPVTQLNVSSSDNAPKSTVVVSDTKVVESDDGVQVIDDTVNDSDAGFDEVDNNIIVDGNSDNNTVPQQTINIKTNTTKKSNNVLKTIGAFTTAGAAVAAGVYGAKKYKEHQEGYDDDDSGEEKHYGFDEKPHSNDEI